MAYQKKAFLTTASLGHFQYLVSLQKQ